MEQLTLPEASAVAVSKPLGDFTVRRDKPGLLFCACAVMENRAVAGNVFPVQAYRELPESKGNVLLS